jgi:3-dehydro-L-gulonate 2-dehydrogenase
MSNSTHSNAALLYIPATEMQSLFESILQKNSFQADTARQCAEIFTTNSVDGVYTHGVNRFPRFVKYVQEGYVHPEAKPSLAHKFGAFEQWDGNLGPGPLNAIQATNTAMGLAAQHGIGGVGLANTNHWMRGGAYGWQAAKKGFVLLAWTNTIANMPAWGALDARLGNNPFVMGLPYEDEAIVLDMAMSQFSFGAMELAVLKNEKLEVPGGYDANGQLSNDPEAILGTSRSIPIGFWKGAGFSLLLDILAAVLSGGMGVHELSKTGVEYQVSQVFIAIDLKKFGANSAITQTIKGIIDDYHASVAIEEGKKITFPGERVMNTRQKNLANGIPVVPKIWEEINSLG